MRVVPFLVRVNVFVLWVTGCNTDRPYDFQPPPGEATFPVVIAPAEKLSSIETDATGPQGNIARVRCATCHAQVDIGTQATHPDQLAGFHRGLQFSHGALSCASCHEPGEPLLLHLATGETFPMEDAMTLCSQCHGPQRRSYDDGAHGGMTGHWDLSRGPRLRNQCVHCHDPHTPQIPQVEPVLPPRDRGVLPPKNSEKGAHR